MLADIVGIERHIGHRLLSAGNARDPPSTCQLSSGRRALNFGHLHHQYAATPAAVVACTWNLLDRLRGASRMAVQSVLREPRERVRLQGPPPEVGTTPRLSRLQPRLHHRSRAEEALRAEPPPSLLPVLQRTLPHAGRSARSLPQRSSSFLV